MTDTISKAHSSDMSASLPDRHRSNSYDYQPKRVRKGSISGRLRTASDLEELGYIDKAQKGLIKDLIISGDTKLQALLDKYEQGDGRELLALIKEGYLSMRKPSIELIEGLDFDFINALRDDDDLHDGGFFADLEADFPSLPPSVKKEPLSTNASKTDTSTNSSVNVKKERRASTDDVAELLLHHNRSRRATLDALLLHDLIFDDHHHNNQGTGNTNGANSNSNTHNSGLLGHDDLLLHDDYLDPSDNVFNDLYQQFSNEQHHNQQTNNNNSYNNGTDSLQHNSNIDLSAYAQHAATLQQGKHILPNNSNNKLNPNNKAGAGIPSQLINTNNSNASLVKKAGAPPTFAPNTNTFLYNPGHNNANNSYGYNNGHNVSSLPNSNNNNNNMPILHNNNNNTMMGYHPNMLNNGNNNMNAVGNNGLPMSVSASALTAAAQRPVGFIGAYSPEQRRQRIEKFLEKRARRVWSRKVKYDVRKNFADSRLRIKGRFVKKEDEDMMRELMNI